MFCFLHVHKAHGSSLLEENIGNKQRNLSKIKTSGIWCEEKNKQGKEEKMLQTGWQGRAF